LTDKRQGKSRTSKNEKPKIEYRTSYIEKLETETKNSKEIEPQTNMNREDAKDAKGFGQD